MFIKCKKDRTTFLHNEVLLITYKSKLKYPHSQTDTQIDEEIYCFKPYPEDPIYPKCITKPTEVSDSTTGRYCM